MAGPANSEGETLLQIRGLKKYFPIKKGLLRRTGGWVKAVDGVSLHIDKGETLGLVGESGCGKSTIGRCILRLLEPTEGEILFAGKNIKALKRAEMKWFRRKVQAVFQDPYASLNPRMSVGQIVGEPLLIHGTHSEAERKERVRELFRKVGLPADCMVRYPHEFSGGQRQRIGIARSLALQPDLIVCDEPVSALDVSIQAQVINLLEDLKDEFGLSYLFIAHDLSVVEYVSNRVAVMYLGKIVELAKDKDLYSHPLHPYTQALLSAIPLPRPKAKKKRTILRGEVPSPINPPAGCRFHPRCPEAMEMCKREEPPVKEMENQHQVACFLYG